MVEAFLERLESEAAGAYHFLASVKERKERQWDGIEDRLLTYMRAPTTNDPYVRFTVPEWVHPCPPFPGPNTRGKASLNPNHNERKIFIATLWAYFARNMIPYVNPLMRADRYVIWSIHRQLGSKVIRENVRTGSVNRNLKGLTRDTFQSLPALSRSCSCAA